ncbi:MAG: gamma-glutamyl-gamma-aminobutyrate hydrolase family protein [Eubacteriales bacterium]|nr:gamma-glutamyl-gamma-aminobutyrate hydrolase family protein [Eubacteriales bacterium]
MKSQRRKVSQYLWLICTWILLTVAFGTGTAEAAKQPKSSQSAEMLYMPVDDTCELFMETDSQDVTWKTSTPKLLTIKKQTNNRAKVTARKAGDALVTAQTSEGKTTLYRIRIYDPIKIEGSASRMNVGDRKNLFLCGTQAKNVQWLSTDKKILSVKKLPGRKAAVTAKKAGTASIKAKVNGRIYRYRIKVEKAPEKPQLAPRIGVVDYGNTISVCTQLNACGAASMVIRSANVDINSYDGLVLPGGTDINPKRYGQQNQASMGIDDALDELQFTVLDKFVKAKKPVFGICRGCQLINIYFGGTLKQNIGGHHGLWHGTTITGGSRLSELYGTGTGVYSSHHQAPDRIGTGLRVTQKAHDGTVEALEHRTLPVWGVQWYPELMGSTGEVVLRDFVEQCKQYNGTSRLGEDLVEMHTKAALS